MEEKGASVAMSLGEDASYLDRSNIPEQPIGALASDDPVLRMRVLAQIIYGKTTAPSQQVVASRIHDRNVIVRRLALEALGKLKDPASVPVIEQGLQDEENSVRCSAALALRDNNRPESAAKMLEAVERHGTHPLVEMVFHSMPRIEPVPREVLAEAAAKHSNPLVRSTAMRSLVFMTDPSLLPTLTAGLRDTDRFVRFAAAEALGHLPHSARGRGDTHRRALKHADPTVSDRAATSQRSDRHHQNAGKPKPLRAKIASGLGDLYAQARRRLPALRRTVGLSARGQCLAEAWIGGRTDSPGLHGSTARPSTGSGSVEDALDSPGHEDVQRSDRERERRIVSQHLPVWLRTPGAVQPVAAKVSNAAPGGARDSCGESETAHQWYVDPEKGDDAHLDGLSSEVSGKSGPLKTIALAVEAIRTW